MRKHDTEPIEPFLVIAGQADSLTFDFGEAADPQRLAQAVYVTEIVSNAAFTKMNSQGPMVLDRWPAGVFSSVAIERRLAARSNK
jgi:hypothetical protein